MGKKISLKEKAYSSIKEKILYNMYIPNQYLDEKSLCEELHISRTPLREAINKLEFEGLVHTIPQKGIFVTDLSIKFITELFQARKVLEPSIASLAIKNLDKKVLLEFRAETTRLIECNDTLGLNEFDYKFHNYINKNCNNFHLVKLMTYISDQFQRVRTQNFYPEARTMRGATEHLTIIDTIIEEKFDEIPALIKSHISSTESYYFKSLLSQ